MPLFLLIQKKIKIHYRLPQNFCKYGKSHLALIQTIFPTFNIIIKSKADLRQL